MPSPSGLRREAKPIRKYAVECCLGALPWRGFCGIMATMHNHPKMRSFFGWILAAIAGCGWPGYGSIVVNYDADTNGTGSLATRTLTQSIDLDGDLANDDSRVSRSFSDLGGSPWSTGASYLGPALFGGFSGEALDGNKNTDDYSLTAFNLRYQTSSPASGRLQLALLFQASEEGLRFDETSSMVISGNGGASAGLSRFENLGQVHWMVRNGTNFYVSNTLIGNANAGTRTLDATELAGELWALYDPQEAANFTLSLTFDTPTSSLKNLNGFGLMVYKPAFTSVRHWLGFSEFKVDAVPVPESSSLALLVLAGTGLVTICQRRRSRPHE